MDAWTVARASEAPASDVHLNGGILLSDWPPVERVRPPGGLPGAATVRGAFSPGVRYARHR